MNFKGKKFYWKDKRVTEKVYYLRMQKKTSKKQIGCGKFVSKFDDTVNNESVIKITLKK